MERCWEDQNFQPLKEVQNQEEEEEKEEEEEEVLKGNLKLGLLRRRKLFKNTLLNL